MYWNVLDDIDGNVQDSANRQSKRAITGLSNQGGQFPRSLRNETGNAMEWTTLRDFAIALLIGALVGTERENRKRQEARESSSGLRTFILMAMAGAVSAWLGSKMGTPWLFIATLFIVTGSLIASYVMTIRVQPEAHGFVIADAIHRVK
jgi:hypothetical protein